MAKAKPFVKWVGGKTQLIDQLEALLPVDFDKWRMSLTLSLLLAEELCSSICCKSNTPYNSSHEFGI